MKMNSVFNWVKKISPSALMALWAVSLGLNSVLLWRIEVNKKVKEVVAAKAAEPARIEVTIIQDSACEDCFDVPAILKQLQAANINIASSRIVERTSDEGRTLVAKYGLARLPAFLATGELDKNDGIKTFVARAGVMKDGAFVFTRTSPPYVVPATGEVKGRFKVIYLTDKSCKECYDVMRHEVALSNLGMKVTESKVVDISSAEGRALVAKYAIAHAPTLILTGDLKERGDFELVWPTVGTVEKDGAHVFREPGEKLMGVYKNLKTGQVIKSPPEPVSSPSASGSSDQPH